eukprot:1192471-Prorocentrum_minimum.AAC.1
MSTVVRQHKVDQRNEAWRAWLVVEFESRVLGLSVVRVVGPISQRRCDVAVVLNLVNLLSLITIVDYDRSHLLQRLLSRLEVESVFAVVRLLGRLGLGVLPALLRLRLALLGVLLVVIGGLEVAALPVRLELVLDHLNELGHEELERGELVDEALGDSAEEHPPSLVGLAAVVVDALHEVEHEAHAGRLHAQREGVVVHVAREEVDDPAELLQAELRAHVVDELGKEAVRQRAQRLVAGAAGSHEHLLVQ